MTARWGRQYQKVTHTWLVAEASGSLGLAGVVRAGGGYGSTQHVDLRGTS